MNIRRLAVRPSQPRYADPSISFPRPVVILASPRPISRLNLISGHLSKKPFLELNTPFSTERTAHLEDEDGKVLLRKTKELQVEPEAKAPAAMSSQPPHAALMIPGPIEFDDAVLQSMSHYRYCNSLLWLPLQDN